MSNSKELFTDLIRNITLEESAEEIRSIAFLLLESKLGLTRTEVLSGKSIPNQVDGLWGDLISRINQHEPVQYVLGEAWFCDRKLFVNQSVLIPRPETEELARLAIERFKTQPAIKLLDVGTGSGCLAITLAASLAGSLAFATDISAEALQVARENAMRLSVPVTFLQSDILTESIPERDFDLIISNPPYIPPTEKGDLRLNVLDHEPGRALFVPQDRPLIFYEAIAQMASSHLKRRGQLMVEINHRFGREVLNCFQSFNFADVKILADLQRKDRFVFATKT